MKKLFVSILALAAFAACQSDFGNDLSVDAPQGGVAVVGGEHTIYAEVGVGEETKATYGDGLKATWEENDQIALLQEHADYGKTFSVVNKLDIKDGWGTSSAAFNGDISVDATSPRVYHIAYPASAAKFNVSSSLVAENVSYQHVDLVWDDSAYERERATGYGKYTYTSNLTITIPTEQNGKWEPYMYASTSEAVSSNAIGAKTLTTLNGAIAIRAFEPDGVTPKQLKSITITSSDAAIAGAFSGTSISVGNTASEYADSDRLSLDVIGNSNQIKCQEEALARLYTKLQGMEPTSTSVTKAMSLSFNGNGKSITATNLETVPMDGKYYTYHVNVAPATFAAGTLTIVAVDANGASLERVVDKEFAIEASHRAGLTLTWEEATLNGATIETWYDNWNTGSQFQLEGNTLYVDNVNVAGNIAADHVLAIGVRINGEFHEASAQSGVLAISPIIINGLSSGVYTVQAVAKVLLNGQEKWLECGEVTKTVTSIPTITDYSVRTSYSSNGGVAKTNNINGDILKVKANLSDSYVASLAGNKYLIYNGNSKIGEQTLNQEWSSTMACAAYDCCAKVQLPNGYVVESQHYATYVTGIPFTYDFDAVRNDSSNWLGWTPQGASKTNAKNGSYKVIKLNSKYMVSPKYHTPASIDITATASCYAYKWVASGSANFVMGATSATNTKSTSGTEQSVSNKINVDSNIVKNATSKSWNITISSTTPYIYIGANQDDTYVLKVSVAYR